MNSSVNMAFAVGMVLIGLGGCDDAGRGKVQANEGSLTSVRANDQAVAVNQSVQVTATVNAADTRTRAGSEPSDTIDKGVTWTIDPGSLGTITSTGLYTAPSTAGTYTVWATSNADPTEKDQCVITVTAAADTGSGSTTGQPTGTGTDGGTGTVTGGGTGTGTGTGGGPSPGTGSHFEAAHITGVTGGGTTPSCPGSGCVSVASYGAVGDCSRDDSGAFRAAMAAATSAGKAVYVPAPSGACYKLTRGIGGANVNNIAAVPVTASIVGQAGVYPKIKMFGATGGGNGWCGNANPGAGILAMVGGTRPIVIAGLDLDGGGNVLRDSFNGSSTMQCWAFDACIQIVAASNVTVRDNYMHDCRGDGLYITGGSSAPHSEHNILVDSNSIQRNTRQQVALVSSSPSTPGIVIINNVIDSTFGYGGALDVEPNGGADWVYNLEFAHNVINQTTNTTGWNGTTVNFDTGFGGLSAQGGNIWSHDNLPGTPNGFGRGWCIGSLKWNPRWTNVHVCASPGN